MIALAHPQMNAVIRFEPGTIPTLVIENRPFFRDLIRDISEQINGMEGETVLSRDHLPMDMRGNAEMIDSFLSFSINSRSLLNQVTASLEKTAVNELFYTRTAELLRSAEQYFDELTQDLTAEIYCAKLNISSLLKAFGIQFREDYETPLEAFIDYMELTREYLREKVFIFVNLRSYFSDAELIPFLETASAHEYRILLIDNKAYDILPNEKRIIIDEDLCEIVP